MVRTLSKLSSLAVSKVKEPGLYGDGGGLWLQVGPNGTKSWLFRYTRHGKAHGMGLGALNAVSLAEARVKAGDCRKLLAAELDPIEAKKNGQAQARLAAAKGTSFEACAHAYIEAHRASWKQESHARQWTRSMEIYVYPVIGNLPVQSIDTDLVLKVLEPIWQKKPLIGKKLRGRMESILDWAKAREYRTGENPARWRGHLKNLLANPSKLVKTRHHPSLPYTKIYDFLQMLDKRTGLGPLAFKLVIFTACRSSEVLGAEWSEVDLENKIWTIPAHRMKAGREHRVPLSAPALAIIKKLKRDRDSIKVIDKAPSPYLFPGSGGDDTHMTRVLRSMLRRIKQPGIDITVHGFRSSFRDWVSEQTDFPREVAEAALAHVVSNQVEAAYRRSDLFDKRRLLMDKWAAYCQKPQSKSKVENMKKAGQSGKKRRT